MTKKRWTTAAVVLGVLLSPTPALALLEVCTVTPGAIAFGAYSTGSAAPTDSTGNINVTCTAVLSIAVNYTIRIGTGGSGSFSPRRLSSGLNTLPYNLYTNASRTIVWGDGSGGTGTISDGYALGLLFVSRNYTVYGRIPAQQNVAPGVYADTLFVTVDY